MALIDTDDILRALVAITWVAMFIVTLVYFCGNSMEPVGYHAFHTFTDLSRSLEDGHCR